MKKLVSILIIAMILLSVFSVVAFAQDNQEQTEKEYIYQNEFEKIYESNIHFGNYFYDELYYHYDYAGSIDWVLVSAQTEPPPPANYYGVFDDMISLSGASYPFEVLYAVYDVSKGEFIDICDLESLDAYEGLREQIYALGFLFPIGDADRDKELTILDATYIQRILAKLEMHPMDDLTSYFSVTDDKLQYISDFDRDGDRTILDATAIQMKLARLDEPIGEDDLVITKEVPYNYNLFPEMPEDSTSVEFELLYTLERPWGYPSSYFEDFYDDIYAIVKTKEQYDQVLNIYNDEFDEEFFETHYAFVAVRRTSNLNMLAPVTDMRIKDNKLYFAANEIYPAGDVISPMESFYTSISAVEKSSLKDVTEIQRVKKSNEPEPDEELVLYTTQDDFIYSKDDEMPQGVAEVEFESKFNYRGSICEEYNRNKYTLSIIKSKEQYDSLYDVNSDSFTDEFFETHYLVAATTEGSCFEAKLPISKLGVDGNTLYIRANESVGTDVVSPLIIRYTSIVAVEKSVLKDVTQIVRVK